MKDNWEIIYSNTFEHKVEIAKAVLEEEGIESVIVNKKDSFYLIGEIELHVKSENVIRALSIIEKEGL